MKYTTHNLKQSVMKTVACFSLLLSSSVSADQELSVELTGAFYASSERSIEQNQDGSAFVYSVLGASRLISDSVSWEFSNECVGFDEVGQSHNTKGIGRCIWRDIEDHRLFLDIKTSGESNTYVITGGTGKWQQAKGTIKSNFTYLPAPDGVYLGVDKGKGSILIPKIK